MKQGKYTKKAIGTMGLIAVTGALFVSGATFVYAQFISTGNTIKVDGYVESINANSLTLLTAAGDSIVVNTETANFVGDAVVNAGDSVRVMAKIVENNTIAQVVKKTNTNYGSGYGIAGDSVMFNNAVVTAYDSGTSITIEDRTNPDITATFVITLSTKIVKKDPSVGAFVNIVGEDNGSQFVAKVIMVK